MQLQWKDIIRIIYLEKVAFSVFYEKESTNLQWQTTDLQLYRPQLLQKYSLVSNFWTEITVETFIWDQCHPEGSQINLQ